MMMIMMRYSQGRRHTRFVKRCGKWNEVVTVMMSMPSRLAQSFGVVVNSTRPRNLMSGWLTLRTHIIHSIFVAVPR